MKNPIFVFLAVIFSFVLEAQAAPAMQPYCLALRGNGELEPAHWGAVANVVEKLGLPQAMAGGSSASITMMLIDGMATNPLVKEAQGLEQAQRASLMIKSLEGFVGVITETKEWRDFLLLFSNVKKIKETQWLDSLIISLKTMNGSSTPTELQALFVQNQQALASAFNTGTQLGLIGVENYPELFEILSRLQKGESLDKIKPQQLKAALFYAQELKSSVEVLGAFNAQTDINLFFRPGIINFDRLAVQLGRIAQFYSGQDAKSEVLSLWQNWLDSCSSVAFKKTWTELNKSQPSCGEQYKHLVKTYFANNPSTSFADQPIGSTILSFPTTTVLVDKVKVKGKTLQANSNTEARQALERYGKVLDANFGETFKLSQPEGVRFGYWGSQSKLELIQKNLSLMFPQDEKSRRFKSLGGDSWGVALGLSPAEPGLSRMKPFVSQGESLVSVGGWSDLNPVQVLRASGCDNVVFATRVGGESLFAQGVAKRVLNFDRDWKWISTSSEESKKLSQQVNNEGDSSDMTSVWSKLYNMANPMSSIRVALQSTDAILCTNWNSFDIKQGVTPMIEDAYASPYSVSDSSGLDTSVLLPVISDAKKYPGCF